MKVWVGNVSRWLKGLVGKGEPVPWVGEVNPRPAGKPWRRPRREKRQTGRILLRSGRWVTGHELRCLVLCGARREKVVA